MATVATKPVSAPAKQKRVRRKRLQLGIAFFLVLAVLATDLYLRSAAFQERVRQKIVAELEQITGGKVLLRSFRWNLAKMEFEAFDLTIQGTEGPKELPYIHLSHIEIRIKIISVFEKEIALSSVVLDDPAVHLIVYPDGSTNIPTPKMKQSQQQTGADQGSPVDSLFALDMDHVSVQRGQFLLNNSTQTMGLSVNDISLDTDYDSSNQQYMVTVQSADIFARTPQFPPLAANVQLALALSRNTMDITSLRFSTPRSHIEVSGNIADFNHPRVQALYKASIDLPEAASFGHVKNVRLGKLELDGAGSFFGQQFAASGKAILKELDYGTGSVRLRDASLSTDYVLTPSRIDLNRLTLAALGGRGTGSMHVLRWRQQETPVAKPKSPQPPKSQPLEQQGTLSLELAGLHLKDMIGMLAANNPSLLAQVNISGAVSGTLSAHWAGSPAHTIAEMALQVNPNATGQAGGIPVSGSLAATYDADSEAAQLSKLDLATRSSHVTASGTLAFSAASSSLQCRLTTADLNEFLSVYRALGEKGQMPVQLTDEASFVGTISGQLAVPRIRGHIALGTFSTSFDSGTHADGKTPAAMQWDHFDADLDYSHNGIAARNGMLRQGSASVAFDADMQTPNGALDKNSPLNMRVVVQGVSVANIESLAGLEYPITGTVSARGQLTGSLANMNGSGSLQALNGVVYNEPYKSLQTQLQFSGEEARFANLVFLINDGVRITGNGAYNPSSRQFNLSFAGKNIDLAAVHRLQSRSAVAGKVQFQASVAGSLEHPVVNADLHLHSLSIAGRPVGEADLVAVTQGSDLKLQGTTELEGAKLALDGHIGLGGDYPSDITVRLDHFDAVPVLRIYASQQIKGNSDIAGALRVSGPLRDPRQLTVDGAVTQFALNMQGYQAKSDGPLRLVLSKQILRVDQFHIVGDETDFRAQGSVDFKSGGEINIGAEGAVNLRLLRTLDPNIYSSGKTSFTVNGRGTIDDPRLFGNLKFENVQFSLIDLPNGLNNVNGTLFFNQDRLQIRQLTAETGGGKIDISGYVAYRKGLFADLIATGKSIRVRYPTGMSTIASANLRFTGTTDAGVLGGNINVEKFSVTPQLDILALIAQSRQSVSVAHPHTELDNIHLDMHVGAASELAVETSLARLKGDLDLHIGGTLARPTVLGRANIFEGDIAFNGTKYHLERGDIVFNNPVKIMPIINVQASARVQAYDVTLGFQGPVDKLNMTYRSDPPLPTADIISLVALGKTQGSEDSAAQQSTQNFVDTDSGAILGEALNATINNRVQKLFGGSRVKIDPDIGNNDTETNPGTHLTVEQQVSNRMTFTYVTNLTQTAEQIIQMEYTVNSHLSILAVRDQNGIVGLSFKVRRRKK